MTAALRVIDTGTASGRRNTALSAVLLRGASEGGRETVVRFYRFTPCVLLGASQAMETGADLAHCAREGVEIARRVTGGGSVYMSPSMLAWDVVTRQTETVEAVSTDIGAALADGLNDQGIDGVRASAAGLCLGGRKISGAATTSQGGHILYQGTLLIEDETAPMAAALGVPLAALQPHVTSVVAETGRAPDLPRLQASLAKHLGQRLVLAVRPCRLSAQELAAAARELASEIGTEAFVRGDDLACGWRASA